MTYQVRVLQRARQDLDEILAFIAERSPEGAARLLASFEQSLAMLEKNPFLSPLAPESQELQEQVRHFLFRGRKKGRVAPRDRSPGRPGPGIWLSPGIRLDWLRQAVSNGLGGYHFFGGVGTTPK